MKMETVTGVGELVKEERKRVYENLKLGKAKEERLVTRRKSKMP